MKNLVDYLIDTPIVAALLAALLLAAGLYVSPFDHGLGALPRDPVAVDALPDIGENQQIVFTPWPGRSPQDVEDQLTYPLTAALLGLPGVRTVRSQSDFGYSSIQLIFDEDIEFYWSRSRILEALASLPEGTLPADARPELGPDATALGQIFWYTLHGPGFDLHELRTLQDTHIRYALQAVEGVAEVASVGGYVREYQIDVNPTALRAHRISLGEVYDAVRRANVEVGAGAIEINRVEYLLRGVGFVRDLNDLRRVVVAERDNVPITLEQIAHITLGPADRRGALDRAGAEAVGGVVVVRYGANPREVIDRVHARIAEIAPGLPSRDGNQVKIDAFYDRTTLIDETLGTLSAALTDEILVTIAVIVVMVWQLRASLLVTAVLPLSVLLAFAGMRLSGVDAHVMSLAGIAIAIGTMVDMGIILTENVLRHLADAPEDEPIPSVVKRATAEVSSAVLTAVATTVVSFLPVFTMTGAEGKLFRPLAFTKTYALLAAIAVAVIVLPSFAALLWRRPRRAQGIDRLRLLGDVMLIALGAIAAATLGWLAALALWLLAAWRLISPRLTPRARAIAAAALNMLTLLTVFALLAWHWAPLGPHFAANLVLVTLIVGGVLAFFALFLRAFEGMLRWCLAHKALFLLMPLALITLGLMIWRGAPVSSWRDTFPGLQEDFMPSLDEGSFLYMPTTMPHASIGEAFDVLQIQDRAIATIPEVEAVVGKIGRVESALDPAPISMIETLITYKPEYGPPDPTTGERPRQWRDHIQGPEDIWAEITAVAQVPGTTAAPRLQPIAARIVMLQSGLRASMGVEVRGPTLEAIETLLIDLEATLRHLEGIDPATVFAERIVGKPYLEIHIDREAIARYGIAIADVQDVIEVAIGGKPITTAVEGRARTAIRVRYPRELRDRPEAIGEVLVPTARGVPIPLAQIAEIHFTRGPMVIKSVDTFLVGYVLFDRAPDAALSEVELVRRASAHLDARVRSGDLTLPEGTSYAFTGTFENQTRATATLQVVLPLSLVLILLLLYIQFRRISTSLIIFTAIAVTWAGGFVLLWCYQQPWFLDAAPFGIDLRALFNVRPFDLTIAVWVGFIALFGIATDDGVLMSTMLDQQFAADKPSTIDAIREATVQAAVRRIRPCLMTTATTLLALLPVVTSDGRGADVMVPMALPSVGGMTFELMTLFVVPVLYCGWRELGVCWERSAR